MSIDPRIMRIPHGRACPRGLAAWGPGGRSGLRSGALVSGTGSLSGTGLIELIFLRIERIANPRRATPHERSILP